MLSLPLLACSQPTFTANNVIPPYLGGFGYGANMGYFPPHYYDKELATLAHGTPDGKVPGVGVTTIRPGLYQYFLDYWGYDIRLPTFRYYDSIGLKNTVAIIGFPADKDRDPAYYCQGSQSELFKNLYEPIWDNGENGTPVNDNNPYALYCWKAATTYKGLIKIWEVWNEPDVDNGNGWKTPGMAGNWFENNPEPCETKLKSPVFFYNRLLRISYEVIKSVDPNSFIAVGGLGYPSFLDVICRNTDNPFDGTVSAQYPQTGGAYFDCMSFHSYPHIDNSMREWSNAVNGFVYNRHSDAAVDGLWRLRDKFNDVLKKYKYDNVNLPGKLWICSEFNIPRREFGDYIGSDQAQENFIVKSMVTAQMYKMAQMHIYSLADDKPADQATGEFSFMGLFRNLNNVSPFNGEINPVAFALKTTQNLLGGSKYDPVQTDRLKLPANIRGAAFVDDLGQYHYVLWAVTTKDQDETADAVYSFPDDFNLEYLDQKYWHFSQTGTHNVVNAKQVALTGSPSFFNTTQITNQYPKQPKMLPNPLKDGFGVYTFWMYDNEEATVEVFDSTGRLIHTLVNHETLVKGPQARLLDLSTQPRGTYVIRMDTRDSHESIRVVKN